MSSSSRVECGGRHVLYAGEISLVQTDRQTDRLLSRRVTQPPSLGQAQAGHCWRVRRIRNSGAPSLVLCPRRILILFLIVPGFLSAGPKCGEPWLVHAFSLDPAALEVAPINLHCHQTCSLHYLYYIKHLCRVPLNQFPIDLKINKILHLKFKLEKKNPHTGGMCSDAVSKCRTRVGQHSARIPDEYLY